MDGGAIDEPSTAKRPCSGSVTTMTGWPASQMLMPATSAGNDSRRISRFLETNGQGYEVARASPPREGTALLQGRAVCGLCGKHFRIRYTARRGRLDAWYVCDRAHGYRGEPNCQSIAGPPIDKAIGMLIAEQMTPTAVELALEIRREIEVRYEEADRLRCRAIERAQIEADLAQRRFMLVDPNNRLVADTLEGEWNEKLRVLAKAREDRERGREQDQLILDEAVRERLIAMTADFSKLWADPDTPARERKRLLAYLIEDVTLIKMPVEGTTRIHVRFKGGRIQTLTTVSPKSSAQQVKTQPGIVDFVDKLLDKHIYSEIAELLNQQGYRPGGSARRGRHDTCFTALRVAYLVQRYGLRSRYDRLRDRGMLTNEKPLRVLTFTKRLSSGGLNMDSLPGMPTMRTITYTRFPHRTCHASNAADEIVLSIELPPSRRKWC